jgi:AraC-like DNA-binding protein
MKPARPSLPGAHPLWAAGLGSCFQFLRVSAAITDGVGWRPIHMNDSISELEVEHGVEGQRAEYNARTLAEVRRKKRSVLGSHAGLSDWFVPIIVKNKVEAFLVTGQFTTTRPTSTDLLERWRWLTGRQGHPADPEFAYYVSMSLAVLTLKPEQVTNFERLLTCMAKLMAGEKAARPLLTEADSLWFGLEESRVVERTWDAAREMVDERTTHLWSGAHMAPGRTFFGLPRAADQVSVALFVSLRTEPEPVDDLLRRDALQRACSEMARRSGHAISGRVGDYGVTFLSAASGSSGRKRERLIELADKAATIARRFGFGLHVGTSSLPISASLSDHYHAALESAENALSQGVRAVNPSPRATPPGFALARLRRNLAEIVKQRAIGLPAQFDRYLEAVAQHSGYRLDAARAHAEAGLERMTEALLESGGLDEKSLLDMLQRLERATRGARTIGELFAAYRRTLVDITDAMVHPVPARRDRSLRRAMDYVHQHYGEPLSLNAVAHVAGFAPNYFSLLFKRREKVTFERYLRNLRVDRAKQLLTTTDLDIQRIAQLCGFGTGQYMARVFRRALGVTPTECRA